MLGRELGELVVIERQVLLAHAILDGVEPLAGLVRGRTVGQVATGVERHAKDGVAGLQERLEDALVGLATGVRLDIGEGAAKELAGAVDGEVFRHVDELATAVVALARIPFRILVGHHRALRLHHGAGDDVFGSDQLDLVPLAAGSSVMAPKSSGSREDRGSVKKPVSRWGAFIVRSSGRGCAGLSRAWTHVGKGKNPT